MAYAIKLMGAQSLPRDCWDCPEHRRAANYERECSEHRSTETQLRSRLAREEGLLREKDVLIHRQEVFGKESDHRLLNDLQMVVSLLSLQSRTQVNAETAKQLTIAANRVATIARIHRHLHSMDGRKIVAFKQYLDELCREYSTMLISPERRDQSIVVEGTDVTLPTTIGIPLGLIVNELVTNAIKHGRGPITVKLEPQSAKGYALSVCNDGSVLPEGFDPAACEGLGMSLVLSLVEQIGGELRIDRGESNEGTRFAVLFSR
jgi:two-component sensor histidine kinase